MNWWYKSLILAIVISTVPVPIFSKQLSQHLYETRKQTICEDANLHEVSKLQNSCHVTKLNVHSQNFDELSELLVFTSIAEGEIARLRCLENESKRIFSDPDILNQALISTCSNLPQLKDALDNESFFSEQVDRYKSILNNSTLRLTSEERKKK
jgi:hypothetical protein